QVSSDVEHAYLSVLIAARQEELARIKVDAIAAGPGVIPVSTNGPATSGGLAVEAAKALVSARSKLAEETASLNALLGYPAETRLELADPPPLVEDAGSDGPALAVDRNPEVMQAQEDVVKAKAAARLAKLEYVPNIAGMWGYSNQTVLPALPNDFSFVGFAV